MCTKYRIQPCTCPFGTAYSSPSKSRRERSQVLRELGQHTAAARALRAPAARAVPSFASALAILAASASPISPADETQGSPQLVLPQVKTSIFVKNRAAQSVPGVGSAANSTARVGSVQRISHPSLKGLRSIPPIPGCPSSSTVYSAQPTTPALTIGDVLQRRHFGHDLPPGCCARQSLLAMQFVFPASYPSSLRGRSSFSRLLPLLFLQLAQNGHQGPEGDDLFTPFRSAFLLRPGTSPVLRRGCAVHRPGAEHGLRSAGQSLARRLRWSAHLGPAGATARSTARSRRRAPRQTRAGPRAYVRDLGRQSSRRAPRRRRWRQSPRMPDAAEDRCRTLHSSGARGRALRLARAAAGELALVAAAHLELVWQVYSRRRCLAKFATRSGEMRRERSRSNRSPRRHWVESGSLDRVPRTNSPQRVPAAIFATETLGGDE
ncbi:hypothetical protein PsYK624_114060 [Phanerochaete sordida]|uniref:Uncharacterized protein n=1 Tax=Phanerochaete sordida TaxID=48140 RepID=A0A9P3GHP4_9APHY|nr:hypothetical protein PsYK624_114060 [Phanerochaete sordida]